MPQPTTPNSTATVATRATTEYLRITECLVRLGGRPGLVAPPTQARAQHLVNDASHPARARPGLDSVDRRGPAAQQPGLPRRCVYAHRARARHPASHSSARCPADPPQAE